MSAEENKATVRGLVEEVFNGRSVAAADQFIAADYVEHSPAPGQGAGLEGFKEFAAAWLAAFHDMRSTIEGHHRRGGQGSGSRYKQRHP